MNSSTIDAQVPLATCLQVDDEAISVDLSDGRTICVPIAWYPRISYGTSKERNHWRLIANGRGIHWPDLDEDISVENLVKGQASGESDASLRQWLAERAN